MSGRPLESSRFFQIKGGNTVVEKRESGWIRWDLWDGPVETDLWTTVSPQLEEIPLEQALKLIASDPYDQ